MKIKKIDLMTVGPLLVPVVDSAHYDRIAEELGVELREYNTFEGEFKEYLNVLCEDLTIRLTLDKGGVVYVKLKQGFAFDFASVPAWLRGRFPSNDRKMAIPALIHDALFDCNVFSFSQANKFYYQLMRLYGNGWWRSKVYYWAVCTDIARKRFERPRIGPEFAFIDWRSK
jgi:hypothetical protein